MSEETMDNTAQAGASGSVRSIPRRPLPDAPARAVPDAGESQEQAAAPDNSMTRSEAEASPDTATLIRSTIEAIEQLTENKKAITAQIKEKFTVLKENAQLSVAAVREVIRRRKLEQEYRRNYVADIRIIESACGQLEFFASDNQPAPATPAGATGNPEAFKAASGQKTSKRPVAAVARSKKKH